MKSAPSCHLRGKCAKPIPKNFPTSDLSPALPTASIPAFPKPNSGLLHVLGALAVQMVFQATVLGNQGLRQIPHYPDRPEPAPELGSVAGFFCAHGDKQRNRNTACGFVFCKGLFIQYPASC
jgi:hypothetical protein